MVETPYEIYDHDKDTDTIKDYFTLALYIPTALVTTKPLGDPGAPYLLKRAVTLNRFWVIVEILGGGGAGSFGVDLINDSGVRIGLITQPALADDRYFFELPLSEPSRILAAGEGFYINILGLVSCGLECLGVDGDYNTGDLD